MMVNLSEEDKNNIAGEWLKVDEDVRQKAQKEIITWCKTRRMESGPMDPADVVVRRSAVGLFKKYRWNDKVDMILDPEFWTYLHWWIEWSYKCNWIEGYIETDKEEILKIKKIEEGKGRTFLYQGAYQWFTDSMLLGGIAAKMHNTPICRAGWVPVHGGFDDIVAEAHSRWGDDWTAVKADCNKFDYSQHAIDVKLNAQAFLSLFLGDEEQKTFVKESFMRRLDLWIKTLDGCVLRKCPLHDDDNCTMCSGDYLTTLGNSLRHFRTFIYTMFKCGAPSLSAVLQNCMVYICSDDCLFIFRNSWAVGKQFKQFEVRQKYYAQCGLMLKRDDDLVTEGTFKGQKWAGVTMDDAGTYVYDVNKLLASANFKNVSGLDDEQYFCKLTSILYLLPHDDESFELISRFIEFMYPHRPKLTRDQALNLLTGRESSLIGTTEVLQAKELKVASVLYDEHNEIRQLNGECLLRYVVSNDGFCHVIQTHGCAWNARWLFNPPNWANVDWCINSKAEFDRHGELEAVPSWGPYPGKSSHLSEMDELRHWLRLIHALLKMTDDSLVNFESWNQEVYDMLRKEYEYINDYFRYATCYVEAFEFLDIVDSSDLEVIQNELISTRNYFLMQGSECITTHRAPAYDHETVRSYMLHTAVSQLQGRGIKLCMKAEKLIKMVQDKKKKTAKNKRRREKQKAKKATGAVKHLVNAEFEKAAKEIREEIASPTFGYGKKSKGAKPKIGANPYLKTLVAPDTYSCRYPDHITAKTGLARTIIEKDFKLGTSGEYRGMVIPQLKSPLALSTKTADDTADNDSYGDYYYELKKDASKHNYVNGGLMVFDENVFQCPKSAVIPFVKNTDGSYDKTKFDLTLSAIAVNAIVFGTESSFDIEGGGGNWSLSLHDSTGLIQVLCNQASNGAMTKRSPALGSTWAHLQFTCTKDIKFKKLKFTLYMPIALNKDARFDRHQFAEESAALDLFDSYRVVGQSVLITYLGDRMYDGGRCVGYYYKGTQDPIEENLMNRDIIAAKPGSYSGSLRDGLYMIWRPAKDLDMAFRDPDDDYFNGGLPVLVFAGKADHDTASIRVRVVTVYEFETTSALIDQEYSPVKPDWITKANIALQGFPFAMGNPIHVKEIRNFLANLVTKGRHAWNTVAPYAQTAWNVGRTALPLLEGLLI